MDAHLDEEDFSLIHALQVRPRATWTQLGSVLDVAPVTLARRWERLRNDGSAWVTAYPRVSVYYELRVAYVELRCASGQVRQLVEELVRWPAVMTIEESSREYSLVLTLFGRGMAELSALLLDQLPSLPGVLNTRSHLAARMHLEGSSWRVGALDKARVQALTTLPASGGGQGGADRPASVTPWERPYADLAEALGMDGRRNAAQLARLVGRPVATVRRQLGRLLAADATTFRCEIAQGHTPSPIVHNWWCRVPVGHVPGCVNQLRTLSTVRQIVSLPGPANLLVTTWMRSIEESMQMQEYLEQDLAPLTVVESALVLRTPKRLGWVLDEHGRAKSYVAPFVRPEPGGG
ncbi:MULTISPECIES: AsnC family transcriptional regulator [Prauserella salsuginis group]|uniref:AsnC family transcriptional regulator n=1 Tax=Prauserella salsuginis TaxID=387889 RepID=A0ABW6G156_9PSEU|nr:Lrp/AsnC family transcriptional regulator [Prauserella flava]MCR3722070.1 DNA-binding transcriptional regulator, Lrp family [Prauserella flava]MCR3736067.1 DNA-binding transcriptional regulator, Lrp family [Prauserella salsuginis]